jgi:peroxiredoxin
LGLSALRTGAVSGQLEGVLMMNLELRKNWLNLLLIAIVVAMGIEIIYLAQQNRKLRAIAANPRQYFQPLEHGDIVPPLTAEDLDGNAVSLDYSPAAPHTLLLWFSTTCSSCEENLHFWNDLYRSFHSSKIRIVGVSADNPAESRTVVADFGLEFPVICISDGSLVEAYKANTLPQTVMISPQGVIQGVWPGPLLQEQRESVINALAQADTLTGKGGDVQ